MFAPLFPGRGARRFLHRLARVQHQLGLLNDAAVAATLMQQLGSFRGRATAIGLVRGYAMARAAGGRASAARRWSRFRRCEPFWT
jgi:CHAD domain-containing protein